MRLAFLIPFRTDNGHREKLFQWTKKRIEFFFPESSIYVGSGGDGEFNRSAAINEAFSQINDERVIVINDADTIWNPTVVVNGLFNLRYDGKFIIPYNTYYIMDTPSTFKLLDLPVYAEILKDEFDYDIIAEENRSVYHAPPISGVLIMRSEHFKDIGGFDERFVGWGEEDVAFVIKATKLLGRPYRPVGDVYHLWHPRGQDYSQPNYGNNQRILRLDYL